MAVDSFRLSCLYCTTVLNASSASGQHKPEREKCKGVRYRDVFDKEMQFDSGFAALIAAVAFKYEFWDQLQFR